MKNDREKFNGNKLVPSILFSVYYFFYKNVSSEISLKKISEKSFGKFARFDMNIKFVSSVGFVYLDVVKDYVKNQGVKHLTYGNPSLKCGEDAVIKF